MRNVPDQQRLNPRPNTEPVGQQGQASADSDRMHSLLSWTQQTGREAQNREPGAARDWPGALSLLQQATEAIRASADQSEKLEARARGLLARATEEIQRAQARIEELEARLHTSEARANAAEARASASEARASAAEARVQETEEWLQRVHDAITTELSAGMGLLNRTKKSSAEPSESSARA